MSGNRALAYLAEPCADSAGGSADVLILKYLPMAQSIAAAAVRKRQNLWGKTYLQKRDIARDVAQDLSVNLIDLVKRFDESKGIPMRAYIARYLWWRVAQLLDSECDRVDHCSEYGEDSVSAVESEGCRRVVGPEKINQPRPPAVSVEDRWAARDSLRHLPEEDAEVVYFYYWEGNTQAEIASKTGRTQAWVSRSLSRSIKKLGSILHK